MGVVRVLVAERWGNVRSGFQSQPTLQLVLRLGYYWWASHLLTLKSEEKGLLLHVYVGVGL